jgi:tetratricopeptide (TPR) repeat protein
MKVLVIGMLGLMAVLVACSGGEKKEAVTKESLVKELTVFEDSLKRNLIPAGSRATTMNYAEKCLVIYRNFPKSKEAPKYLDKAHVILSSSGLHGLAVLYADTLINNYPNYKNRPMVLQSLASSYDLFIIPRKKELVIKYYTMLLKENPNLPKEERETVQFRLDNIDKTFDELIELQTKD